MNKRDFLRTSAAFLLPAAAGTFSALATAATTTPALIRVGVRGGVDEEIWEVVAKVAKERKANTAQAKQATEERKADWPANHHLSSPLLR